MKIRGTFRGKRVLARVGAACAAGAVLATPARGQAWEDQGSPEVNVSDYGTVDLAVQDTDLAQVLEMLSIQGRKNIITSKNVAATVSANLYDVTFYEALDAILSVNGYGYVEEGNFIYIYTQEELAEVEAASRQTETRIFSLEYLSASDAQEFITPLLSEAGRAAVRGEVQSGIQPDISDAGADSYAYEAKVVVNDYEANLEDIAALLEEIDTPPQQVLIETTVLQTVLNEDNSFGVDFSAIADMNFLDLTNPLSPVTDLITGTFQPPDNKAGGFQSTTGNVSGAGGFKVGVVTDEISVFLKLLDEVTDTSVLARPKILCLNRQRAEVLVGQRLGYLSSTTTQTATTQTVEFLDVGVQLVVRPFISKSGMIRLELAPSLSDGAVEPQTDNQGNTVSIPRETTSELTTNVRVRDGHTVVLGGLFREEASVTRNQIPWLGDIPLLGAAFRGQTDDVSRTEITFLITPSVVPDEILWELGDGASAGADAVRVGTRKGLLPFSRSQVTGNYGRKAVNALQAGNITMALHWVHTALRLNPNQPEMIALRDEITGERERSFDRSLMERYFRKELGPLPREKSRLPREVTAVGGSRRAPLNWLENFEPTQPTTEWPTAPTQTPDNRTTPGNQSMDDDPMIWDDDPMQDDPADSQGNGPMSFVDPGRNHGTTNQMPPAPGHPPFWQAGNDPGGFDDPTWKQANPFTTFDDVLDVAGIGDDRDT